MEHCHSSRGLGLLIAALSLTGCPKTESPRTVKRCEVDLGATGFFAQEGTGSLAKVIDSDAMLIGGQGATGRIGDVLLRNDKIKLVIEQPGRVIGPMISGGGLVDADIVRPDGEAGRDLFGRWALIYAFGRVSSVTAVEVLADGSAGGPAVVASTGHDSEHDLINLENLLYYQAGLRVKFVVDAYKPLNLISTTYYVLSPGESRVRVLTAFCNQGTSTAVLPIIELVDMGAPDIFNPGGCSNGLGIDKADPTKCILEPSKWFGAQGDGVAYGLRSYQFNRPQTPVVANAMIGYAGLVGGLVEGESIKGVLSWTDEQARSRPGVFSVRAGEQRSYLRDVVVGTDLGASSGSWLKADGAPHGELRVATVLAGGASAPNARVAVTRDGVMQTLLASDALGRASVTLAPGEYQLTASTPGRLVGSPRTVTVVAGQTVESPALELGPAHFLQVSVKDPFGKGMPAKVTVHCVGGCPFSAETYKQHMLVDVPGGGSAMGGFVPVSGKLMMTLPPGEYEVVVTRGPEYSAWPDTWPVSGQRVDLRTGDAEVNAVLAQVVDTTGWVSADLHVHANNSLDSAVIMGERVANFLAEGVDVLLSTDHDVITDYAPVVQVLGAQDFIATMIGLEVTTFSHGHFNTYPLTRKPTANGGAFDHAGGEAGPTLRLSQMFSGIKAEHPGALVQLNHPRGTSGSVSMLQVDTATLASHGNAADYLMVPADDAIPSDTKLFSDQFDTYETANGPTPAFRLLNDWMTFLSRGTVRTSVGASDTHYTFSSAGGYSRTYARMAAEAPADFSPVTFAEALSAQYAIVTNGPFVRCTARKLDAGGLPVGPAVDIGDTVSLNPAAGEALEITVDVQAPEWVVFNRIELYSYAPGRESVNGDSNDEWPDGRIFASRVLDPLTWQLEPVPGLNGLSMRRVHVVEKFVVHPVDDTWFVAMVRSIDGPSLWPFHASKPMAFTNAILVDADGSGRYDDYPLKPGQPLRVPYGKPKPNAKVPTERELKDAIWKVLEHRHD